MLEVISSKEKHNCFKSTFLFLSGLSYLGNSNKCSYSFCIAHVSSVPWVTVNIQQLLPSERLA